MQICDAFSVSLIFETYRLPTDFRPHFISTTFLPTKCVLATPYHFWHDVFKHFQTRLFIPYLRFHRFFEMPIHHQLLLHYYCPSMSHYFYGISLWTSCWHFEKQMYYPPLRGKYCIDLFGLQIKVIIQDIVQRETTSLSSFLFSTHFFFSNLRGFLRRSKKAPFSFSFQNFHGDCGHGRHGRIPIYRPKPYHQDSIALKSKWF